MAGQMMDGQTDGPKSECLWLLIGGKGIKKGKKYSSCTHSRIMGQKFWSCCEIALKVVVKSCIYNEQKLRKVVS